MARIPAIIVIAARSGSGISNNKLTRSILETGHLVAT
jgi:hypothetical protein